MLEKVSAFKTTDGQTFASLDDAKHHELVCLFQDKDQPDTVNPVNVQFANMCMAEPEKIVDILTTGPRSLPKARKVNGGRKNRPAKTATPESAPTP